jgi:hypothetical protein
MLTLDAWRREVGLVFEAEKPAALTLPTSGRPLARRPQHNMKYGTVAGVNKPISRLVMGTMIFKADALPLACSLLDHFYAVVRHGPCLPLRRNGGPVDSVARHPPGARHPRQRGAR